MQLALCLQHISQNTSAGQNQRLNDLVFCILYGFQHLEEHSEFHQHLLAPQSHEVGSHTDRLKKYG